MNEPRQVGGSIGKAIKKFRKAQDENLIVHESKEKQLGSDNRKGKEEKSYNTSTQSCLRLLCNGWFGGRKYANCGFTTLLKCSG